MNGTIPKLVARSDSPHPAESADGRFDTTRYATRLRQDHPAVAYWLSWHDYYVSATDIAHLSLIGNRNAAGLLGDPYVINADRVAVGGRPPLRPSPGGPVDRR